MGKKDFARTHYQAACNELYAGAPPSLKVSYYSDRYVPGKNFAIVIMYHWKGNLTWFNAHKGHRGRFLYVAFQNTDAWPSDRFEEAGAGRVHNFIYKDTFGEEWSENKASCGGAGIKDGMLKFSSLWLNKQGSSAYNHKWESDGKKYLTNEERAIVRFATKMWMRDGPHHTYTLPSSLHEYLMGRDQGVHIPEEGLPLADL